MSSVNRVILVGRLGQDPKLKATQSGQARERTAGEVSALPIECIEGCIAELSTRRALLSAPPPTAQEIDARMARLNAQYGLTPATPQVARGLSEEERAEVEEIRTWLTGAPERDAFARTMLGGARRLLALLDRLTGTGARTEGDDGR